MMDDLYRYSATVNGKRRVAVIKAPVGLGAGDVVKLVDNDEKAYNVFYRDATEEDYEAEREDELVERYGWSEVEDV